jgi:hypothetical protein
MHPGRAGYSPQIATLSSGLQMTAGAANAVAGINGKLHTTAQPRSQHTARLRKACWQNTGAADKTQTQAETQASAAQP